MNRNDISACLALLALPGAGAVTVSRLLRAAPAPAEVFSLPTPELEILGLRGDTIQQLRAAGTRFRASHERQSDWLMANDVRVLLQRSDSYPPLLAATAGAPAVLFVRGDLAALHAPQIAVVGSRRPTPAGREIATGLAADLAGFGLTVGSGLAIGIDTAAHEGALLGGGQTLAVMGTGPDEVYPRRNARLATDILARGGALVTEFAPGARPEPANFPRRNRIISGLSLGVLVVEAGLPSGSLLTAHHAVEQNREVMAVPGPIRSPTSRGCHELLRQGAALVERAEDVLQALGDRFRPRAHASSPANEEPPEALQLSGAERAILQATGFEDTPVDLIISRTGLAAATVGATLVALELRGLLTRCAGGYARSN